MGVNMHSFAELEQARIEWMAWRTVCHELERNGIDLNGDDRLAAALQLWGEELVALRNWQDGDLLQRVRNEKRRKFSDLGMELATQ